LGFSGVLENLEYNKLIFPVMEMSLNLTKFKNLMEKILPLEKAHLESKKVNK